MSVSDHLTPYTDVDPDGALAALAAAYDSMHKRLDEALREDDKGSGLRRMLDPARCPDWALEWLANWVGGPSLQSLTVEQQRELIRYAPGWRRGTREAVEATIRTYLPAGSRFSLIERDGGPRNLTVHTFTDTPVDTARLEQALRLSVPYYIKLIYKHTDTWLVGELEDYFDAQTVGDVEDTFATVADAEDHIL